VVVVTGAGHLAADGLTGCGWSAGAPLAEAEDVLAKRDDIDRVLS
jgi:hypothetical protein